MASKVVPKLAQFVKEGLLLQVFWLDEQQHTDWVDCNAFQSLLQCSVVISDVTLSEVLVVEASGRAIGPQARNCRFCVAVFCGSVVAG